MGRPKIKIIDDSQPEAEIKDQKSQPKAGRPLDEKIKNTAQNSKIEEAVKNTGDNEQIPTLRPNVGSHNDNEKQAEPKKKAQKPGKSKPRSEKYNAKIETLDRQQSYSLDEAVAKVKEVSYSKYPGTLEIHINTRQNGLRGLVSLPFVTGKKLTILAFGKGAEESGADIIGDENTIEEISKGLPAGRQGKINFDLVLTTADWMPKLAKVAKNLGPKGLMPSPKNGTITTDLKKAVEGFQSGKTEYKSEPKAQLIHLALGKLAQPDEELTANVKTLLMTIGKSRIKKVTLAPTIGPSIKLDLSSI